jgi:UDP-2,4-diacetamido-2,4,6-trideoxy-beta-L-altropyranose hydrolase
MPRRLAERLSDERCDVEILTIRPGTEDDVRQVIKVSQNERPQLVVVDGYQFTDGYEARLAASGCNVLAFDDHRHATHRDAKIILNQNLGAEKQDYYSCAPQSELLLGARYALLRQEFLNRSKPRGEIERAASRVLVTLGGGDSHDITTRVVRAIQRTEQGYSVCLVLGPANDKGDSIRNMVRADNRFEVHQDVRDMSALYEWADVAICAGGSANWEMCYFGIPRLLIELADNQADICRELARHDCGLNLGWHADVTPERIADALAQLTSNPDQHHRMKRNSMSVVDGKGVERVVDAMSLANERLEIAPPKVS